MESKKIIRHYHPSSSLQSTQNKSQSANNLLSFTKAHQDHHASKPSKPHLTHHDAAPAFAAVSEPNVVESGAAEVSSTAKSVSVGQGGKSLGLSVVSQAPPTSSSSSSYFPLEPTMEECLESLDISYDTTNSLNDLVAAVVHTPTLTSTESSTANKKEGKLINVTI